MTGIDSKQPKSAFQMKPDNAANDSRIDTYSDRDLDREQSQSEDQGLLPTAWVGVRIATRICGQTILALGLIAGVYVVSVTSGAHPLLAGVLTLVAAVFAAACLGTMPDASAGAGADTNSGGRR